MVVAGPTVPLLPAELELLSGYARNDGRLVVMADVGDEPRRQLNSLLEPWGIRYGDGVVSDLSALAGDPASVVSASYPSSSPATEALRDAEIPVVFVNSAPVEPVATDGRRRPPQRPGPIQPEELDKDPAPAAPQDPSPWPPSSTTAG